MRLCVLETQSLECGVQIDHFPIETIEHEFLDAVQLLHFLLDGQSHPFDVGPHLIVALIDRQHFVEFVFHLPEDAVAAEQSVVRFAVDGDHAVVFQTADWVFRSDEQCEGVEGVGEFFSVVS
jgi:hypothetical protein